MIELIIVADGSVAVVIVATEPDRHLDIGELDVYKRQRLFYTFQRSFSLFPRFEKQRKAPEKFHPPGKSNLRFLADVYKRQAWR